MSKILLLILLIAGLIIGVILIGQKTNLFSRADISITPQEIKISNISDNSFTVSWITDKATVGFVKYGESEQLKNTASDDRDPGAQKERLTHHVTLRNLDPEKVYSYKIFSGTGVYDNKGKAFKQATASISETVPTVPEPIFGKVTKQDGTLLSEALVYLTVGDSSLLSSYTRDQGNWLITLNNARSNDLASYITLKDDDLVNLSIQVGLEGNVKVEARIGETNTFSQIVLPVQKSPKVKVQDSNKDKLINIFDYILFAIRKN